MSGIWSPAPGHVIGASASHLFHLDPSGTIRHASPPTATPYLNYIPVWGSAPDDVWSMGFTSAIHFDGTEWAEVPGISFAAAMHGTARDDVWAVGFSSIFHYDGVSWQEVGDFDSTFGFTDVWAVGPGEAVVVGISGTTPLAMHVGADGATANLDVPGTGSATTVYASSAEDMLVGVGATLQRYSGGSWDEIAIGTSPSDMWGTSSSDVWMTGATNQVLHWNGAELEEHTIDGPRLLLRITATASDDLWVSDIDGAMHHYDGSAWTSLKAPLSYEDFVAVAALDDGQAWAIGTLQTLASRDASGEWSIAESPATSRPSGLVRVGEEIFLFTSTGSFRRNGEAWDPLTGGGGLVDACATADGTIWAAGDRLARYDDGAWTEVPVSTSSIDEVHCAGDEAWAVDRAELGSRGIGVTLHYDGDRWARIGLASISSLTIRSSYVASADDAWVVASPETGDAVVMRFDGAEWRDVPVEGSVLGVGGSGPNDVWLVGQAGLARRWDGSTLSAHDAASAPDFAWVRGAGDGTATAVAYSGAVWEFDGATWTEASPGLSANVTISSDGLREAGFVNGEIFAAGTSSEALRHTEASGWEVLGGFFQAEQVAVSDEAGAWFMDSLGRVSQWNGTALEERSTEIGTRGDLAVASADVYLVSSDAVTRFDGTSFDTEEHRVDAEIVAFFGGGDALWLVTLDDLISVTHQVWRKIDGTWALHPELTAPIEVALDEEGSVVAVGVDLAVYRREDGIFRALQTGLEGLAGYTVSAHVYSATDVWALASNGLLHFDGDSWSTLVDPVGIGFNALASSPNGTLYAVGRGASVVRRAP